MYLEKPKRLIIWDRGWYMKAAGVPGEKSIPQKSSQFKFR